MVEGLLGILKAGAAYLPLDPAYPPERMKFILSDAKVLALVSQRSLLHKMPLRTEAICVDSDRDAIDQEPTANPVKLTRADNLAYALYTSGSTGQPKGILIEHKSVVNYLSWVRDSLFDGPMTEIPSISSIAFDASLKQIFGQLISGGKIWIISESALIEGDRLLETLGQAERLAINCVPTFWEAILQLIEQSGDAKKLERLRRLYLGGERFTNDIVNRTKTVLPWVQIYNLYGPSETTSNASAGEISSGSDITIGRPISNTKVYILDRNLSPAPVGVAGELYIAGDGLARGYLNRADTMAERFIPNPFGKREGERLYRTGDVVRYLNNGTIEFIGRADNQVKVRGYRIELEEIEAVLEQHAGIKQAAVVVTEAESGARLEGYVVSEEGLRSRDVKTYLSERLPEYMVPEVIVTLEELPINAHGKVDRKALSGLFIREEAARKEIKVARTPIEEILAQLWCEVLGKDQVSVDDDFFELGGHSILAMIIRSRITKSFNVDFPLGWLFDTPTIAQLAQRIEAETKESWLNELNDITRCDRSESLPLSYAQERLWFIDQLKPGDSAYNVPTAFRLEGNLNDAALERSINEIVRRHDVLRTTFPSVQGKPRQEISADRFETIARVDLSHMRKAEREREIGRLIKDDGTRRFDLSRGPLYRVMLVKESDNEQILFLTMHHIVTDGWSMGLFIEELSKLYQGYVLKGESPLQELEIQYADYAVWQRGWLSGRVLDTQLEYWKKQMEGAPPMLELPTDRPRPAVLTFFGAYAPFKVSEEVSEGIKRLSRREGATVFMTLLGAFQVLLYRYSGQEDICVGTPIANRNRAEIEKLIGFFVNALLMRGRMGGDPSFRDIVGRVRATALEAYAHQDMPFERLVEELEPERSLSYSPLFQIVFALQNAPKGELQLEGLKLRQMEREFNVIKYDLMLAMKESRGAMFGAMGYQSDLFDEATVNRMIGHFQQLLENIVKDADQSVSEIALLSADERNQVLQEWNDTRRLFPTDICINELFEQQAESKPEAVAIIYEDQYLTYEELNRRANQVAHFLRRKGVGPEALIGVCVERNIEMVVGLLGILKAGELMCRSTRTTRPKGSHSF